MSVTARRRYLDPLEPNSLPDGICIESTNDNKASFAGMTTPEYIRIHANASPSKLREIIKTKIFPNDDVAYLKRLVNDVGHMHYVFRFLWYDGPKPVSYFEEWDHNTQMEFPQKRSTGASRWNESPTRGESNWGSSTHAPRRRAVSASSRGVDAEEKQRSTPCLSNPKNNRSTRTWIQYCCYYNAHQCLQWIFHEILQNYSDGVNQEKCKQASESNDEELQRSLFRERNSRKLSKEGDKAGIIKQLLEYPSHCYCAANYVAVSAIRNSYDCLLLLLQYGRLEPNMKINSHGSTAGHLAAWKNNVECLNVLNSGCYKCGVLDDKNDDSFISEHSISDDSHEGNQSTHDAAPGLAEHTTVSPVPTCSVELIKTWTADWTATNEQGETPLHVAAREGSYDAMQFFLDLAISYGEKNVMQGLYSSDNENVSTRPHCLSEDGAKGIECNLDKFDDDPYPPVDFSLRNKNGMDCTALAAQHNHAKIIELTASALKKMREVGHEISLDIQQNVSEGFWNNPLLPPQDRSTTNLPSHSHLTSLRHRANSDPVKLYDEHIVSKSKTSEYHVNNQLFLPRYFPSLNLNNTLERNNHETPIHIAARLGHLSVVKALFNSDCCDTSACDSLGRTALHIAVLADHLDIIEFFAEIPLEQFRKFDVVDILGRTPLYIASSAGNSSIVRKLASISNWRVICHEKKQLTDSPLLVNVARQPALHAAVVNNHVDTVSFMLASGVDVEQLDVDGRTAINAAAKLGYYDMCQILILHGANVNARSSKGGPTPYQKAKKYKHNNVADLLYEFGGW